MKHKDIERHDGFFYLNQSHIDIGEPREPTTCPLAYCIGDQELVPYKDVHIERQTITYECENIEFAKETAWDLYALLSAIDFPDIIITATNTETKESELLFSQDKRPIYPITIYEYEHYFSAHITDRKDTFMDIWHPSYKSKRDEYGDLITTHIEIHYKPHTFS